MKGGKIILIVLLIIALLVAAFVIFNRFNCKSKYKNKTREDLKQELAKNGLPYKDDMSMDEMEHDLLMTCISKNLSFSKK